MSLSLACAPDAYSDFREYQVVLAPPLAAV